MLEPLWRNFFENVATVQFDHRVLGIVTGLSAIVLWLASPRAAIPRRARIAVHHVGAMGLIQPALGIATLINVVPPPLALLHQAGAMALLSSVLWYLVELTLAARSETP
jgi:cytochrome c oxidase assembly protein subunit 15